MPMMTVRELASELKVHNETVWKRLVSAGIIARPKPMKYEILPFGRGFTRWKYINGRDQLVFDLDSVRSYICVKHEYMP